MNVVRTTTLAVGASLIGSSLSMVLAKPDVLPSIFLLMGFIFLLHGAGFLQEFIVRKILKWYRTKKPVIGIVNDLPWSPWPEKGTYAWAWSKMKPDEWCSKINSAIKKSRINTNPKLIKITKPWTRWFLDRYVIIINPYGSVYPEVDIKELTVWKSVLHYVLHGGRFVNVADIPFYWAYDPRREIRYELVKYFHQYVPIYKQISSDEWHPAIGGILSFGPYPETPFLSELRINVINTERIEGEDINPRYYPLKFKTSLSKSNDLDSVAINRGVVIGKIEKGKRKIEVKHVESLVEEVEWDGKLVTPFCSIYFGEGKFLVSLIFLEYDKQPENVRGKITNLQCDLVIREVKDMLKD